MSDWQFSVRRESFRKAFVPIEVTLFGMRTTVRFVQLANALAPIVVTLFGIVTSSIEVDPSKAESLIVFNPAGRVIPLMQPLFNR